MVLILTKVTKISFAKEDLEENATLEVKKCCNITTGQVLSGCQLISSKTTGQVLTGCQLNTIF
jgi:hypothetical protein